MEWRASFRKCAARASVEGLGAELARIRASEAELEAPIRARYCRAIGGGEGPRQGS